MADATDRFNRREGVVGVARHFGVNAGAIAATAGALMALRPLDAMMTFDGASAAENQSLMNLTLFKTRVVGGNMHFDVSIAPDDGRMFAAALRPSAKRALIGIIRSDVTLVGRYGGKEVSGVFRSTHIWIYTDGRWQLLMNQLTAVAP